MSRAFFKKSETVINALWPPFHLLILLKLASRLAIGAPCARRMSLLLCVWNNEGFFVCLFVVFVGGVYL